jgi:hypothetical protein
MKYLTLNTDGLVINVIIWDGTTPYNPGQGDTLIALTDAPQGAWTGWTYINGVWTPPPAPPDTDSDEPF